MLDWPGVHAAPALLSGELLEGVWYNRTKEYLVKIKGKKTDPDRFAEPEMLTLAPLPCWNHLSPEAYRTRIAKLIHQIEADAAAQREAAGRKPLGAEAILRQDPKTEPNRTKKSPAPRFHAVRKWVRKELYQTYTLFVQSYREAAELLRMGNRNAVFPRGCFPAVALRGITPQYLSRSLTLRCLRDVGGVCSLRLNLVPPPKPFQGAPERSMRLLSRLS